VLVSNFPSAPKKIFLLSFLMSYIGFNLSCQNRSFTSKQNNSKGILDGDRGCQPPMAKGLSKFKGTKADLPVYDVCSASSLGFLEPMPSKSTTLAERRDRIKLLKIGKFSAAPGFTFVRDNSLFEKAKQKWQSGEALENAEIILNIVSLKTSESEQFGVDVWSGHEALLALMSQGAETLDQLGGKVPLTILVEGWTPKAATQWQHWISAAGFDFDSGIPRKTVHSTQSHNEGTLEVGPTFSNYSLGSRSSLNGVLEFGARANKNKIALQFGTFDPPHEGHVNLSIHALKEVGFDESILLPNYNASHKPGATPVEHRVAMTVARVEAVSDSKIEEKMNVFSGNSSTIMNEFGIGVFFERMQNLYATSEVWSLIGDDAYDGGVLRQGLLQPQMKMKYLVFLRGDRDLNSVWVPPYVQSEVKIVEKKEEKNLSSTLMKKKIAAGEALLPDEISPVVVEYIKSNGLYGVKK
jgi:cytidyltransferase-like protein